MLFEQRGKSVSQAQKLEQDSVGDFTLPRAEYLFDPTKAFCIE